jgi:hypothetical protein
VGRHQSGDGAVFAVAFGLSFWLHRRVERNPRLVQPT